ncbi:MULTISPECIES: hypothetical protein [Lactobacillus]|uniref:hypothetical protein n=1 Tax=Lactobacillus TaxID=1578 RepID=UPI000CDA0EE2|nr:MULTISPECIES: hypothetical protein [Lactobacillus]MCO6533266.1 hypothetical protein [Lactobacillus sp.]MCX8725085.1 hypothetical protein [Lactobacillus sp. B4007]
MKFSYEQETDLTAADIWQYYANIDNWFAWEGDLEKVTLDGDFIQGTKGQMKLEGQPAMDFVLESVTANEEFTDRTPIPGMGDVYFTHQIGKKGAKTTITHSVEFVPQNREANSADLKFVAEIFADVPESIFALEKAARKND